MLRFSIAAHGAVTRREFRDVRKSGHYGKDRRYG